MTRMYNKRGFTLVEIVTTIAIITILMAMTSIGVTDYIRRTKDAGEQVKLVRSGLAEIDEEVSFDSQGQSFANSVVNDEAAQQAAQAAAVNEAVGNTLSGDLGAGVVDIVEDEVAPTPEPIPDPVINNKLQSAAAKYPEVYNNIIGQLTGNATYLNGAGNVDQIIASCAARAVEDAINKKATLPKFVAVIPATGEARVTGSGMEALYGQNVTRCDLHAADETAAVNLKELGVGFGNIRSQLDNYFLTTRNEDRPDMLAYRNGLNGDTRHELYFGVYRDENGDIQVVPNICIDANGNYNIVNTYNFTHKKTDAATEYDGSNVDQFYRAHNGFYDYVRFVTDANGNILDLSNSPESARTSNAAWVEYVESLRTGN